MKSRLLVPELMDDPTLDPHEHRNALAGLSRINTLCGTARELSREILDVISRRRLQAISILDVGCGGGDVALSVAKRLVPFLPLQLEGWDMSSTAIHASQDRWKAFQAKRRVRDQLHTANASFRQVNILESQEASFDIVYCSLFLHHFSEPDAIRIVRSMLQIAQHAVIVDDLLRTRFGYFLAKLGCYIFSRSPVVHFDGPQSVLAAFSESEIIDIAHKALAPQVVLRRHWPQRFSLLLEKPI